MPGSIHRSSPAERTSRMSSRNRRILTRHLVFNELVFLMARSRVGDDSSLDGLLAKAEQS